MEVVKKESDYLKCPKHGKVLAWMNIEVEQTDYNGKWCWLCIIDACKRFGVYHHPAEECIESVNDDTYTRNCVDKDVCVHIKEQAQTIEELVKIVKEDIKDCHISDGWKSCDECSEDGGYCELYQALRKAERGE